PQGALARLERHAGKLARAVLRGLGESNLARLPGIGETCRMVTRPDPTHYPPHARRPQSPADRPQRRVEPPLDCRRQTLSVVEPVWLGGRVGLCDGACAG